MHTYKKILVFGLTALLSACAVGPNYVRPDAPVQVKFKEAKGKKVMDAKKSKDWKIAKPRDACDRGKWWRVFHEEQLNALEDQLNNSNQSIINAYYNYRQAYALVDEARASFFPTMAGSVSLTRQKPSSGGGSNTGFSSSSSSTTFTGTSSSGGGSSANITTTHTVALNASWEPDIWGLVRRQVEAASGGAQASAALLASTRLMSQASLAQYYFELRGLDTDQKLLNDTVAEYKKLLRYTKNRYAQGVAARLDVVTAQSQLESAQASAINNGILRGQYEHAIAVLIGMPPGNFALLPSPLLRASPPPVPLGVASDLLERRPDIAQAERLMMQANAQIGVADAAYFPTLTLSGMVDFVGQNFSHWVSLPIMGWSYGAALTETIFDGGLRNATVRAATAGYKASVANYRQVVLAAFQDVEDNLVSLRLLNQQVKALNKAASDARIALQISINEYKAGTLDISSVITAANTAFAAEKAAADINYLRMTSAVGLVRSLGGGWDASEIACAAVVEQPFIAK